MRILGIEFRIIKGKIVGIGKSRCSHCIYSYGCSLPTRSQPYSCGDYRESRTDIVLALIIVIISYLSVVASVLALGYIAVLVALGELLK